MLSQRGFFIAVGAALAATSLRIGIGLAELAPPIENLAKKIGSLFHTETFIFYRHGENNELKGRHERTFNIYEVPGEDLTSDLRWFENGELRFEGEV